MSLHSYKTQLQDRTLWFDGDTSFNADTLMSVVTKYNIKYVDKINDLVKQYNNNTDRESQICVKTECNPLSQDWTIPEQYQKMDVIEYLSNKHCELLSQVDGQEHDARDRRLAQELVLFHKYQLIDVLRTIIYIINSLTVNDVVWGVGRGSSVSSYVLYIIGVHDVDSFAYDLDITDFLHS